MPTLTPSRKIAYHAKDGPVEMYAIDANSAVANHPDEWSFKPHGPAGAKYDAKLDTDIPPSWRDLPTQQRRQIAIKLGEAQTITGAQADEVLAAEEKRRENIKPEPEPPRTPYPKPSPQVRPTPQDDVEKANREKAAREAAEQAARDRQSKQGDKQS